MLNKRIRLGIEQLESRCTPTTCTWTSAGDQVHWSDLSNWDAGKVPGAGDSAIIGHTTADIDVDTDVTVSNLTLTSDFTASLHLLHSLTITMNGAFVGNGKISSDVSTAYLNINGITNWTGGILGHGIGTTNVRINNGGTLIISDSAYILGANIYVGPDGSAASLLLRNFNTSNLGQGIDFEAGYNITVYTNSEFDIQADDTAVGRYFGPLPQGANTGYINDYGKIIKNYSGKITLGLPIYVRPGGSISLGGESTNTNALEVTIGNTTTNNDSIYCNGAIYLGSKGQTYSTELDADVGLTIINPGSKLYTYGPSTQYIKSGYGQQSVDFNNGAVVMIGADATAANPFYGKLSISGDITFNAGSTLAVAVNGQVVNVCDKILQPLGECYINGGTLTVTVYNGPLKSKNNYLIINSMIHRLFTSVPTQFTQSNVGGYWITAK
jgi:hypothetical protein